MSMSNTTENDVLLMMLKGTDPAWRTASTLYISLHTADPGETGTAITNETSYGGYSRVPVIKASGWSDGGSTFSNDALIQFPQCTSGTVTLMYFGVVTTASGAGQLLVSGQLSSNLGVSAGIQPQFAAGDLDVTAD